MRPTFRHVTLAAVLLPLLFVAATAAAQPVTQWLSKTIELLQSRKDWPAMLEHSRRWTKAQPGNGMAWNSLGYAYYIAGQSLRPCRSKDLFSHCVTGCATAGALVLRWARSFTHSTGTAKLRLCPSAR